MYTCDQRTSLVHIQVTTLRLMLALMLMLICSVMTSSQQCSDSEMKCVVDGASNSCWQGS